MFTETRAMFLYATSPVHMGAGAAVGGLIDNPIQRERHTEHPLLAGSGIKGAVRHRFLSQLPEEVRRDPEARKSSLVNRVFGPETDASEYAGAVSFSDAQLLAFPVRSLKRAFVYGTCPTALARAGRLLDQAGIDLGWHAEPPIETGRCRVTDGAALSGEELLLEAFRFTALPLKDSENLHAAAVWLAANGLPEGAAWTYFARKLESDLVLLSDEEFGYFARNATVVEPHVRIDDNSGTADDGGLFYTENLPPESLLIGLVMASDERGAVRHREDGAASLAAAEVIDWIAHGDGDGCAGIDGQTLQIGGDASTGRGLVQARFAGGAQ